MSFDGVEKRRHPRREYHEKVDFCLSSRPDRKLFCGASVDISDSGMCMYTFDGMKKGELLEIRNEIPSPCSRAEVVWVKEYCGDFFKVGIKFVD